MTCIPLAQHLVPGFAQPPPPSPAAVLAGGSGAHTATAAAAAAAAGAGGGGPPELQLLCPAYLADNPVCDLRHIADKRRVLALPQEERVRYARTCVDGGWPWPWPWPWRGRWGHE